MANSDNLVEAGASEAPEWEEPAKPALISLGMAYLYLCGGAVILVAGLFLKMQLEGRELTCELNARVAGPEVCNYAGVPLILALSAAIFFFAEVIRRNLWWSREAVFGVTVLCGSYLAVKSWQWSVPQTLMDLRIVAIALGAFAFWYLYRKPNVVAFYDLLKRRRFPERRDRGKKGGEALQQLLSENPADPESGEDPDAPQPKVPRLISLLIPVLYLSALAVPAGVALTLYYATGEFDVDLGFFTGTGYKATAGFEAFTTPLGYSALFFCLAYCFLAVVFAELLRWSFWWTRELLFGLLVWIAAHSNLLSSASTSPFEGLAQPLMNALNLALMAAVCIGAFWYFYRKPDVKAYYDRLTLDQAADR